MVMRKKQNFILIFLLVLVSLDCSGARKYTSSVTDLRRDCPRRVIRYTIDSHFGINHSNLIRDIMPNFVEIGVDVLEVRHEDHPNVTIRYWRNEGSEDRCEDSRIGVYRHHANYVEVDPDCSESDYQFQVTVLHEVGHWLGLRHICNTDGRTTNNYCSRVGRGSAIMNPYIDWAQSPHFTDLDRMERSRTCNLNNVFGG